MSIFPFRVSAQERHLALHDLAASLEPIEVNAARQGFRPVAAAVPRDLVTSSRKRKQAQNRQIALALLRAQLWEIEEEKRLEKLGKARSVIGRAMRAEKIRTYNYPQNRVTDHRIAVSWHALDTIIDGDLEKVLLEVRQKLENPEKLTED